MNTRNRICAGPLHHRPGDEAINSHYKDVVVFRGRRGDLSLPSLIGAERRINLF